MDTFKIRAILTAAKYRSLSRAAEEFSYTPSAFSHMTAAFEEEIGLPLFHRSSTGVTLTEEGKALLPKFQKILQNEDDLLATVATLRDPKMFELRIGTYPSIARTLLSGIFHQFKTEYPHIRLSVHVADVLRGWLEEDHADLIFGDPVAFGKHEWIPLREDRYAAVVPEHWLPGQNPLTLEDLYPFPHIFTDDCYLQDTFDFDRFPDVIYFKSEDDLSVINMVKEGIGFAILPELVLSGDFTGVSIRQLEPKITRSLGFIYNKKRIHSLGLTKWVKSLKM